MRTKEVLDLVGFKQREIEWLQETGVIDKPQKNKYGHFEYTEKDVDKIWIVKFFREVGYKNEEIKDILSSKEYDENVALNDLICKLELKIEKLENFITVAKSIRDNGKSIVTTRYSFSFIEDINFDSTISLLGMMYRALRNIKKENYELISTQEVDKNLLIEHILNFIELCNSEVSIESSKVQSSIKKIHKLYANGNMDLMSDFFDFISIFSPESDLSLGIDEKYGKGKSKFIYDSLKYYCQNNFGETDKKFIKVAIELINLCSMGYEIGSDEVQRQVKKLHNVFNSIIVTSYRGQIELLKSISKMLGSREFFMVLEDEVAEEIFCYFSKAIEFYVNNLEKKEELL